MYSFTLKVLDTSWTCGPPYILRTVGYFLPGVKLWGLNTMEQITSPLFILVVNTSGTTRGLISLRPSETRTRRKNKQNKPLYQGQRTTYNTQISNTVCNSFSPLNIHSYFWSYKRWEKKNCLSNSYINLIYQNVKQKGFSKSTTFFYTVSFIQKSRRL